MNIHRVRHPVIPFEGVELNNLIIRNAVHFRTAP